MARTAAISIQDFETIVLLDECDTPMQEAYVHEYWKRGLEDIYKYGFAFEEKNVLIKNT